MTLSNLSREKCNQLYREVLGDNDTEAMRKLCREDLFFLLTIACKRKDINRQWLFERCREVQENPDEHLDLWAREHYKSTIITFGKSMQDILVDPDNTTIGIFSHTRPIAKGFLNQIKLELEGNQYLKDLFPEILYQNPKKESPIWSLDNGIVVKRNTNPKEKTVEAWGIVDGQPTSKHFSVLVYDDVVTRESVTNPDMIKKVTGAWELSLNLGSAGGKTRYIGTRYHANDTYKVMMDRGSVTPRIKPATHNGKLDGEPVFLDGEVLRKKRRDMGPYTFGSQMLQDPVGDNQMGFRGEWLAFYNTLNHTKDWNFYITVDPASSKKKGSDYTVMEVNGLAPDGNYYLVDALRDRLNLTERAENLFRLHRKWKPKAVGYEKYGKDSDIEHIEYQMEQESYRFKIIELGGSMAKEDRILRLVPIFGQGRYFMPKTLYFIDYEGKQQDYIQLLIENEYNSFPVAVHDDMLDCKARILDPALNAKFPEIKDDKPKLKPTRRPVIGGWMG